MVLGAQEITAVSSAMININFQANDVYLVMSGDGTITETLNGKPYKTVAVGYRVSTHCSRTSTARADSLDFLHQGLEAYDFTFG